MKFLTLNRTIVVAGLAIGILSFVLTFYLQQPKKILGSSTVVAGGEKIFTVAELVKYDGSNSSLPIYLALDGNVYDVTPGKKFYAVGGAYHSLAGRDSSTMLHLVGGDIIKKKYKVVGKLAGGG
jgi:predicted heme/steroid binding protein